MIRPLFLVLLLTTPTSAPVAQTDLSPNPTFPWEVPGYKDPTIIAPAPPMHPIPAPVQIIPATPPRPVRPIIIQPRVYPPYYGYPPHSFPRNPTPRHER